MHSPPTGAELEVNVQRTTDMVAAPPTRMAPPLALEFGCPTAAVFFKKACRALVRTQSALFSPEAAQPPRRVRVAERK